MHIEFHESTRSTLGVEWEIALVDRATAELTPRGEDVLNAAIEAYPELGEVGTDHPHVTVEFLQNTVEMVTGICENVGQAVRQLAETQDRLREVADPHGLEIFAAGTHPFSHWNSQAVVDKERYAKVVERAQYWARQMVIYGLHVHVGINSREKALPVIAGLMKYYPHLLALSANSPYWDGQDTGYASHRALIFQQLSTAGLPIHFDTWAEYERYTQDLLDTGVIEEISENRWDIRPVPKYGTVEMRVCDGPSTLTQVGALTAFTQCLVEAFSRQLDRGEPIAPLASWHQAENKWRAARYGLDATVVVNNQNEQRPLRQEILDKVDVLMPLARELDCERELRNVEELIREPGDVRQRRIAQENGGDLQAVVMDIVERNRTDRG